MERPEEEESKENVTSIFPQILYCDAVYSKDSIIKTPMIFIKLDNEDLATSEGETGHRISLSQAVHKIFYLQAQSRIPQRR